MYCVVNGCFCRVYGAPVVIQVSDELKLSESESARLVLAAAESTPRDGNDLVTHHHNIATAAVRLWYDERQAELRALATLLKVTDRFFFFFSRQISICNS